MLSNNISLPPTADFHVHLRDGPMSELVTPTITQGGVDTVYVMPNLIPPITTVERALSYKSHLQRLAPNVTFLMTLYLHPDITPAVIAEAARAGISGVKSYPAGVTTNSAAGVLDYRQFYPVFEAMQEHDLVLNLHGELPSSAGEEDITILNAESRFLPTLRQLHVDFPRLRIVLEHCTTKDAIEAVKKCGPTVAATITAHHLWITLDDWAGDVYCFCKPVAKTPKDRRALVRAVVENDGKFFFGSDSAPHPVEAKKGGRKAAAGCFTQSHATALVVGALEQAVEKGWLKEEEVTQEALEGFLGRYGRAFYKMSEASKAARITLRKGEEKIPQMLESEDGSVKVVPFKAGDETWSCSWD